MAPAWWNGSRIVHGVCQRGNTVETGVEEVHLRARCSRKGCHRGSWTIYAGDAYPHRSFHLGVVVSAVSANIGGEHRYEVATRHECCGDTVRRWRRWTESLIGDVEEWKRSCTKLAGDGMAGAEPIENVPPAAGVLHLLNCFAELLDQRGVALPEPHAPGVVRILVYLLRRSSEVIWLTKQSPPLRAQLEAICL